jgi:Mg2+ and Co2+ transporter CorA
MPYLSGFESHAANHTDLCRSILDAYDEHMVNKLMNSDNKLELAEAIIDLVVDAHLEYAELVEKELEECDKDDVSDYPGEGYNGAI